MEEPGRDAGLNAHEAATEGVGRREAAGNKQHGGKKQRRNEKSRLSSSYNNPRDTRRHVQAAEALGAIGSAEVVPILEHFLNDSFTEVVETCQIALDRIKWVQNHDKRY